MFDRAFPPNAESFLILLNLLVQSQTPESCSVILEENLRVYIYRFIFKGKLEIYFGNKMCADRNIFVIHLLQSQEIPEHIFTSY